MVNVACYVVLTIAWALFSGTTRLVSLATSAFFGVGMYTVAVLAKVAPLYAAFGAAAVVGAALAFVVGVVTLRISGMFFVIFGFGLSEMIRQLTTWWEINLTHTMGRYVYVPFDTVMIYEHLLALAVLVFLVAQLCEANLDVSHHDLRPTVHHRRIGHTKRRAKFRHRRKPLGDHRCDPDRIAAQEIRLRRVP